MIGAARAELTHESAAALVCDGRLVAAAEEERFNRVKHGKPAEVDNPHHLPEQSIRYVLKQGGLASGDIDGVAYSFCPDLRQRLFSVDAYSREGTWGSKHGEAVFLERLNDVPASLERILGRSIPPAHFHWVPHHIAHAACAYYLSGYERAAVLVLDGIGESHSGVSGVMAGDRFTPHSDFAYPNSIGFTWEKLCKFLGFSEYDACKVMGMAAYGNASNVRSALDRFLSVDADGGFRCDPDVLRYRLDEMDPLAALLGAPRNAGEQLTQRHYDLAAGLQEWTDRAVLGAARRLRVESGLNALCYAGGVALNCSTNWQLVNRGVFDKLYIPSAPHDAGTAPGAALMIARASSVPGRGGSPYIGPDFSDNEVESALRQAQLPFTRVGDSAREAASLLAAGHIVAWFQGRMEFGPRALGNRSLLADPRRSASRERMNALVKRREGFRPFAPSVLQEHAHEWFELGQVGPAHELMLVACPGKPGVDERVPAVMHVDGTARVHIVRRESNPRMMPFGPSPTARSMP